MFNYIINFNGKNKELAIFEFENLWNLYFNEKIKLKIIEHTYFNFQSKKIIINKKDFLSRLTYTNNIFNCLFKTDNFNNFKDNLNKFDLKEYNNKSFLFRIKRTKSTEKNRDLGEREIAKDIFKKFEKPKVDLTNPQNEFNLLINSKASDFYFSVKIYENQKGYKNRMPKLRPVVMPYTLKSDMARAAINCLNIKKGRLLDPFCGIGGILLEAHDMKFNVLGNDISWNDLRDMKKNFEYYFDGFIPDIILSDSRDRVLKENSIDAIVTDIPYGKCSRKLGADLYDMFLTNAKKYLKQNSRLVIIYANFTEFKKIAIKHFTEIIEIEEYINSSMTRHILVLENNK